MRWLAIAVVLLLAARSAPASEQSEALSARALVELHEGRIKEAMALFDTAVATDPKDPLARYQRGVAYAKEKRYEEAVEDQEQALALRPDLDEAALELGIGLVELGREKEARRWLTQAQKQPELDAQASFFLGIADLREGQLASARSNFERARLKDPSVELSSRYYLGVVEYRAGSVSAARDHFGFVTETSPDSAVGRESEAFLEIIRQGQGADTQIYGGLSFQYDTNVVLAPAQGLAVGISNVADGRATINVGGVYVPWRGDHASLSVGYDYYQNVQFRLHDFDLIDNRPTVQFRYDFGPFRGGVLTQYDFYLLDYSALLQQVTAMPYLVFPEKDIGRTEVYLRYQYIDYLQDDFDILDANDYAGGLRQVLSLGAEGGEAWVGYLVENYDTPSPKQYSYEANQGEVGVYWPLPWTTSVQVGYRFRREVYANASALAFPPAGKARLDDEHRGSVAFRKDLTELVSLVASWIGTFNMSNKDDFEYDRQIGSIGVEVRY